MSQGTKFCKHCGQIIDSDCVVCPKCGKQVENLNSYGGNGNGPIILITIITTTIITLWVVTIVWSAQKAGW